MSDVSEIIILVLLLIGAITWVLTNAFKIDEKSKKLVPTCEKYIINSYVYALIFLVVVLLVPLLSLKNATMYNLLTNLPVFIIAVIAAIVLSISLRYTDKQRYWLSHILFIGVTICISITNSGIIMYAKGFQILDIAIWLTLLLAGLLSVIGYYYGFKIVDKTTYDYLVWVLLGLVVISIVLMFFNPPPIVFVLLAVAFLIVFSLLLIGKSAYLKENAEKCDDGTNIANYPREGFGIGITVLNIFNQIVRLLGRRMGRRGYVRR